MQPRHVPHETVAARTALMNLMPRTRVITLKHLDALLPGNGRRRRYRGTVRQAIHGAKDCTRLTARLEVL